jgi:DNA-binding response OmpR family regulator/nitrogen-specific signal transduction histidine kinase
VEELRHLLVQLEEDCDRRELERKRCTEQLAQISRLSDLGIMSASVLHEMNQPLLGIKGFAELILNQSKAGKPERTLEWVAEILEQVERIQELQARISNYLRRDDQGSTQAATGPVVQEALRLFEHRLQRQRVNLVQTIEADLPRVSIQPLHLRQIVVNLVGNALDAMEPQSQCALTLRAWYDRTSGMARLVVADNGPGIPVEIRARIFEPFFTTKGQKGTGLGLYIGSTLAAAYGGSLSLVDPAQLGWPTAPSTAFMLSLPVPAPVAQPAPAPLPKPKAAAEGVVARLNRQLTEHARGLGVSQRVLLVDDEPVIQRVLSEFLASQVILTDVVVSAEEALERLRDREYAVVVTDKNLPGLDGIELLRQVKKGWPRTEVIIITGYASVESALDAIGEGAFDYLAKPFPTLSYVGDKVRMALARHDFECRVHSMIGFLTEACRALFTEAGGAGEDACSARLREILTSYGQAEVQGKVLVLGTQSMANAVERQGFGATRVDTLSQAREVLARQEIHVVVFVEGAEGQFNASVMQALRSSSPNVGIFVIGQEANLKPIVDAIGIGVGDYLARPLEGRDLFPTRLKRLVSRQQQVTRYRRLLEALKTLNIDLACAQMPPRIGQEQPPRP